uniref:Proline rich 35 n=1 Tax=Varanus komodoensis TaxID=61221 RepID=A0A8D2L3V5_VARKO
MSKEEMACKLAPVYKHKERKPKKPHYIPRPWGKPYNYKCFQCPFTCMEKSHLYNHMKYSLCKNSLSLLIESDWPYKKGNLLHPELRLLQGTESSRAQGRQEEPESKDPAGPDFVITDVFSLKKHIVKGKEPNSLELEAKPKHCKVPKRFSGGGSGVLMEQWKLVANGQRRSASEVTPPCLEGNVIPCYPPPAYGEFHEPQSLNLSLLGINYPLNPNLFSYLSPSVANNTVPHSHLAQLPFLASTAQLMHPHSAHFQPLQNPERSTFLPRFYYPLLFEHSFSSTESKMATVKPEAQQPPVPAGLLKVPVLKTGLPWMKGFREEVPPEQSLKTLSGRSVRFQLPSAPSSMLHTCPLEDQEKTGSLDILSPGISAADHHRFVKPSKEQPITICPRDPEVTTVLIGDLSKTLEEYQEVERKLSDLAKEDATAQKQLRDQLVKIRQELFHIHQALEKATKPNEGPLDLSVKRSSKCLENGPQDTKEPKAPAKCEKVQGKDPGSIHRCLAGAVAGETIKQGEVSDCLLKTDSKTIDLLIKMSHSENLRASTASEAHLGAVIKAEVLPLNVPLELRNVMDPYYSRTTKCEADSSVLLCTDGRSNASQGPPLPMTEDVPLGCRAIPRSLSCGLLSETEGVCIHSPMNADP